MNIYTKVSLHIAACFCIAIFASFVPDNLHSFFGDWLCHGQYDGQLKSIQCNYAGSGWHNPEWHWGWRHWLWAFMSFALFIVQVVKIWNLVEKETSK